MLCVKLANADKRSTKEQALDGSDRRNEGTWEPAEIRGGSSQEISSLFAPSEQVIDRFCAASG